MAGQIRHKRQKQEGQKKRVRSRLWRYNSRSLFLFIVAFSAAMLYYSSKMLRTSRKHHSIFNVRVFDSEASFRKQKERFFKWTKDSIWKLKQSKKSSIDSKKTAESVLTNGFETLNTSATNISSITACQKHPVHLLILIFSEERQSLLRSSIRNTWCRKQLHINNRRMTCLFMVGMYSKYEIFSDAVVEEASMKGDIILMSLHDDIRNSTLKMITSMKWVTSNCPKVDFVLRTEDDVIIDTDKLMNEIIPGIPPQRFSGGKCTIQSPVRDKYSKYFVSLEEYPGQEFPQVCTSIGYLLSYDVFKKLYQLTSSVKPVVAIDDIFVGISLEQIKINSTNLKNFVYQKLFQLSSKTHQVLCNYVIVHLHGNKEEDTDEAWKLMKTKCIKFSV